MDVNDLIEASKKSTKRIAVIGDPMIDEWVEGVVGHCQDHCWKITQGGQPRRTPGGAANAAWQLEAHWNVRVTRLGLWNKLPTCPVKRRFTGEQGRIVFRHDEGEGTNYGLSKQGLADFRAAALAKLKMEEWDGVLISDYDKGLLDRETINAIMDYCCEKKVPCVIDAKRDQNFYRGRSWGYQSWPVIKANYAWKERFLGSTYAPTVITRGSEPPWIYAPGETRQPVSTQPVHCINHVGAGDCFAAHLALCLAHGMSLEDAVPVAHAAGRVYVQHPFNRAPWPHEIRKDLMPALGKHVWREQMRELRESLPGKKIVFTNGVFRLPHAGHAWLFDWAAKQGDVLVVGFNTIPDQAHAGKYSMSIDERLTIITAMQSVDWLVGFHEETPESLIRELRPDVLVKGHEYKDERIPGDDIVKDVRFAPESPFPAHASHIIEAIKR